MNSISRSSEERVIAGETLTWHRWQPPADQLRGALFFLHGQGDYGERYEEIANHFGARGLAFATCDLPGHGLSPGRRGHVPSLEIVRTVARLGMTEARELAGENPVGFGGHSVGGLLALALLPELEEAPTFSWISSPLLDAKAGQPPWKPALLRPLSRLLPTLTVSTGVRAEMCRQYLPGESATEPLQFHNRISLSWGNALIALSDQVRQHPGRLPSDTALLLTQGGRDRICPPDICQAYAARLKRDNFRFHFYPEARHEPFADEQRAEVFADLGHWLDEVLATPGD
ncbi:alpha/beta fold hydrolase [Roseibacillus ishigakijimensis]|uniref:Alpha/beta fold hydrolase n=1 Tax=Roseibacillus ishigakijimensis TaxID=454146 RepID=A0A934RP71_9BACT|nr:alpha/beta fold hydrolase [Roseibacillus ishigakijimensis]MBK1834430.1 alpha/beta fold hydrolase [Roseibacillus ishigakijimensis]